MSDDPSLYAVFAHIHLMMVETALVIRVVRRLSPHVTQVHARVDGLPCECRLDQESLVIRKVVDPARIDIGAHPAARIARGRIGRVVRVDRHEVGASVMLVGLIAIQDDVVELEPETHLSPNDRTHAPKVGGGFFGCDRLGMLSRMIETLDREVDGLFVLPVVEELTSTHVVREPITGVWIPLVRRLSRADEVPIVSVRTLRPENELERSIFCNVNRRRVERPEARSIAGLKLTQITGIAGHRRGRRLENHVLRSDGYTLQPRLPSPVSAVLGPSHDPIGLPSVDGSVEVDRVGVFDRRLVVDRERVPESGEIRVLVEGSLDAVMDEAGEIPVPLGEVSSRRLRREILRIIDRVPSGFQVVDQVVERRAELVLCGLRICVEINLRHRLPLRLADFLPPLESSLPIVSNRAHPIHTVSRPGWSRMSSKRALRQAPNRTRFESTMLIPFSRGSRLPPIVFSRQKTTLMVLRPREQRLAGEEASNNAHPTPVREQTNHAFQTEKEMDPLQRLLDIEAIKSLKARYQRAVDTKDWDLMRSVLAPEARSVYSDGKHAFEGREAIVKFLSDPRGLGNAKIQSMHHAHTPEIEIISETTARGTWYLEDFVVTAMPSDWAANGTVMHGTGIYHDEYVKIDGDWFIQQTGYERIFEDIQPRGEGARLRTRWDGQSA
jgi:hypothetical protein